MADKNELNQEILEFGRDIFSKIGASQPKVFDRNFLHSKMMEWSFNQPEFKVNLFRLVDVLPALQSSKSIAKHVQEYLHQPVGNVNKTLEYGLKAISLGGVSSLSALAVKKSVNQMASVFIAGESPQEAIPALEELLDDGIAFTVDLLGEYSLSQAESFAYLERYLDALSVFGDSSHSWSPKWKNPAHPGAEKVVNVSVKLSALYSQCSVLNFEKSVEVLSERLGQILEQAMAVNAHIYLDAEDTAHNPIIYQTFKKVFSSKKFEDFPLPGIVIQAYAKDSQSLLEEMLDYAKEHNKRIAVRLVKGAYWDAETAGAAQNYWENPLFIEKAESDRNFETLAKILLDNIDHCYPAFGSHNIRSLSYACCYAKNQGIGKDQFELQMLYGMAMPIAKAFTSLDYLVRMYVPLGELIPGMGYLVRRLLENTSNDSFLRHTFYESEEIDTLLAQP